MATLEDACASLAQVYGEIPACPCKACGQCCVTPHMTFLEFACVLKGMLEALGGEEIAGCLRSEQEPAARFSGNFLCALQAADGRCRLHAWRPLSCRLEGFPILDQMSGRAAPMCPHSEGHALPDAPGKAAVEAWIHRVQDLNQPFGAEPCEPYWVNGLNLECWLAVLLDPRIAQPYFLALRRHLLNALPCAAWAGHYVDHTRLAEKLGLIDQFFAANEAQKPERALKCMRRILHGFPRTGTHYQTEGKQYLDLMKRIIRQRAGS